MTDAWSSRAAAYRESPTHASDADLEIVVEMCNPHEGVKALDVATGGGHVARRLREQGAEVVTADPAPGMQADVVCAAEDLPFADGSFDVVVTRIAPHHFSDIGAAVGELARVSNRVVVVEDTEYTSEEVEAAEKLRDPTHVRNYSEDEWRELLESAGSRDRACRALHQDTSAGSVACAHRVHRRRRGPRARAARAAHLGGRLRLAGHEADPESEEVTKVMAIIVDNDTKLVVSGLTGSEGRFHGLRNKAYGTKLVAGVTPGKGGQDVEGVPVYDTVADAVRKEGANTSMIFVPARFAPDAIYEAVDAGISTVICITEHIPAHEMLRVYTYVRPKGVTLIGPNCPGVLSPGKSNVGIIPAEVFQPGKIGLVSRSGTLTYQIGNELAQRGLGNSTIVGIGGDPVVGSSFIDILEKFEADPETETVVLVGEIGGDEEEKAARYVADHMSKPVFSYIAGFSAPPGKTMGHAGAIISGSSGTATAKKDALEAVGIKVGTTPTEVAELVVAAG